MNDTAICIKLIENRYSYKYKRLHFCRSLLKYQQVKKQNESTGLSTGNWPENLFLASG